MEFADKIVIMTGTSGIARATALRLVGAGARVIALGIDQQANQALAEAHPSITVQFADVTDAEQVGAAVAMAVALGGPDILINAAAVHPYGTVVETSAAVFARCLAVNIGGVHLLAHLAIPAMRAHGRGGAIVNLASVQGHACQQGVAAYVATKGAIHALTRAMALDHAADGIRVNSVSPGSVRTPMLELAARRFDGPDADVAATFARFGAAHPLGRIAEGEEVAELIAFLASPRAGFCTGGDYLIDGGLLAGIGVR